MLFIALIIGIIMFLFFILKFFKEVLNDNEELSEEEDIEVLDI